MLFFNSNLSVFVNLQSKFGSPNGSVWQSLPHLFLFFHWILLHFYCLCLKSMLPRLSVLHCPSSQELPKPKHGAVCLRVSSVFLPSLDQMCPCLLTKKDEPAPARSLHPTLNLLLRDHKEIVSLWTGFRLDEFRKSATNSPKIVNWGIFLDRILRHEHDVTGLLLFYTVELEAFQ